MRSDLGALAWARLQDSTNISHPPPLRCDKLGCGVYVCWFGFFLRETLESQSSRYLIPSGYF